jgi:alpha-tubulin suppressor-like RCC1 family protein
VYTWGHAANGRLGLGDLERVGADERTKNFFPIPDYHRTLEPIRILACGADHTLAVGSAGCWAWGNGAGGKLGFGDIHDRKEPNIVPRLRGKYITSIVASTWHSMAIVQYPPILEGGYLYTWGSGFQGQLAHGTQSTCLEPNVVEYFLHVHTMIKAIAAGPSHCLAVSKDGEVYSWGNNQHGALGR